MIVIGSIAADLSGNLPLWRDGNTGDIDIVTNSSCHDESLVAISKDALCVRRLDHLPDHTIVLTKEFKVVDITLSDEFYYLVNEFGDLSETEMFGVKCKFPDIETLMALKVAYKHLHIHREKNDKDLSYWRDIGITPREEHKKLIEYVSKTAERNMK